VKISIENFKSIRQLHEFEIKPMTILSGVNSSGKSSFIQFLLLMKQSLEKSSTKEVLDLKGEYFQTNSFVDLVNQKNIANDVSFSFSLSPNQFTIPTYLIDFSEFVINGSLSQLNKIIYLTNFEIDLISKEKNASKKFTLKNIHHSEYNLKTNIDIFGDRLMEDNSYNIYVDFVSIFPDKFERYLDLKGDSAKGYHPRVYDVFKMDWIKNGIDSFFENIHYIGPARVKPKESYYEDKGNEKYVGLDGGFTAQIMHDLADEKVASKKLTEENTTFRYEAFNGELLNVINYWLCDYFGVGGKIYAKKENDNFKIFLKDDNDLEINIRHVGYGISQILPIIVQGLLLTKGQTLIIEQPELHLHPKLQSKLYDFLYSLTLKEVKVIVETHSSHFITRMRRRIAEDISNEMDDLINLTFIEHGVFKKLNIDDYAVMDHFPEDFIESYETEISALIQAQMNKRLKNK